jgi:predicted PurR-regulated permease PerM
MFWVATLAVGLAAAALLRDILLPFVAGILLAYLLDAPVNRLERIGFNRAAAALVIIGVFLVAVIVLIVLTAPFFGAEIAAFIDDFPAYVPAAAVARKDFEAACDKSNELCCVKVLAQFFLVHKASCG